MLHPFFASDRPLVFAHRGGSALAPENTMDAFANGMALGADGLELDVHASRDGVVVVHHDRSLDRTTTLRGPIAERTASELHAVRVPALADVFREHRTCRIIVELKVNDAVFAASVVDVIRSAGAAERVCLGSFGYRVLRAVRQIAPEMATSAAREEVRWALYRSKLGWPVRRVGYTGYQIPECAGTTRVVSSRFVRHSHAAGLGVQVWTVDAVEDAMRLLGWGVDALITDRPDIIVPLVRAGGSLSR